MIEYSYLVSVEGDPRKDPTAGRYQYPITGPTGVFMDLMVDEHAECAAMAHLEDRGVDEDTEVFVFCETTGEHYRFDVEAAVRYEYNLSRHCGYPSKDPEGT